MNKVKALLLAIIVTFVEVNPMTVMAAETPKITAMYYWDTLSGAKLDVKTDGSGYMDFELYNHNSKLVDKAYDKYSVSNTFNDVKLGVYKARVRSHEEKDSEYSDWSDWAYCVSPSRFNSDYIRNHMTKHKVTLKWSKVSGAKKYILYGSRDKDSGYKKIKTTTKTSYKVTKFNGKTLDLNKNMYFKLIVVGTMDGKILKSTNAITSCIYLG